MAESCQTGEDACQPGECSRDELRPSSGQSLDCSARSEATGFSSRIPGARSRESRDVERDFRLRLRADCTKSGEENQFD